MDENKGLGFLTRALRHRNFRLFFGGQSVSLIGTWIQQVALGWLVYRLTHSAFLLGAVGFAGQIPTFLGTPLSGVFADRWNRHRAIVLTQSLAMIQALTLAALTLTGQITVWGIIGLNLLMGMITAIDMPMRQSFLVEMIEAREDLPNAIALNSLIVNGARLIGPALAGLLLATMSEGVCFLLNGLSYLAVIWALLAMKVRPRPKHPAAAHVLADLKEGFHYAFGFAPIRIVLLLVALVSLVALPYAVLMPVYARDILRGGSHTLGFLMAAAGLGALAGSIFLASRKTILGTGRRMVWALVVLGVGLMLFSHSRRLWLSLPALVLVGFGMISHLASCNTFLQTIVDEDKRGRVMSFYTMAFMGMAPFGSLIDGALADWFGAPNTFLLGGAVCLGGGGLFATQLPRLRRMVHPIYVKKGIMPEVAAGLQSATNFTLPPED